MPILQRHCQFSTPNLQLPTTQPDRERENLFLSRMSTIQHCVLWSTLSSTESENFVATRNFLNAAEDLLIYSSESHWIKHFVAPSSYPCTIVACDCLQRSSHSHHVLSPLSLVVTTQRRMWLMTSQIVNQEDLALLIYICFYTRPSVPSVPD